MDADFKKKYGKYIKTGDKLLEKRKDYKVLHVSPALDIALGGGIREGSWVMISGDPKKGKEQPLTSRIYTPSGTKFMGDIAKGDEVYTPNGEIAKVVGVYPQGKKDVWALYFDDGSRAECGEEHLWELSDGKEFHILKTMEIDPTKDWYVRNTLIENYPWTIDYTDHKFFTRSEVYMALDFFRSKGYFAKAHFNKENSKYTIELEKERARRLIGMSYVGVKECQCIAIDHESRLYVTDNFLPTHNTTLVMQMVKNAQDEGRKIMYLNVEGRLKEKNFQVEGLDPSKMQIVEAEDKPLSAETYLDIGRYFIEDPENEGGVLVIDSLSSLLPARDMDEDISGMTRPGLPKIISDFCKKLGQIVPNQRAFVIAITHMITNTSGYGKQKMADGGVKIQFQADTRLEVKSSSVWESGTEKIGLKTTWDILESSMGAPYTTADSWIRFGKGIDKIQEIIILASELGLISKSGSWYYLDFIPHASPDQRIKFQGQEKIYEYLTSNLNWYVELEKQVREML